MVFEVPATVQHRGAMYLIKLTSKILTFSTDMLLKDYRLQSEVVLFSTTFYLPLSFVCADIPQTSSFKWPSLSFLTAHYNPRAEVSLLDYALYLLLYGGAEENYSNIFNNPY